MSVRIDLENDLKKWLLNELMQMGHRQIATETDTHRLLVDFLSLRLKTVMPIPRKVYKSDAIKVMEKKGDFLEKIRNFEKLFSEGRDVRPYLSKRINKINEYDYLLNDWGIKHLHLTIVDESKVRYASRADNLLFFMLDPQSVLFIAVRPHQEKDVFANDELLEIVYRNWPSVLDPFQLKDVVEMRHEIDKEARRVLREKHANSITKIGSKYFFSPGGGMSSSGHNTRVIMYVDFLWEHINNIEKDILENEEKYRKAIEEKGLILKEQLDFVPVFREEDDKFLVVEKNSGLGFDFLSREK